MGRNCRFMQGMGTSRSAVARLRKALSQQQKCTVQLLNYRKDGETEDWAGGDALCGHHTVGRMRPRMRSQCLNTLVTEIYEHILIFITLISFCIL